MTNFILPIFTPNVNEEIEQSRVKASIYCDNEEERKSLDNNFKRIMFVGKSGIGKSTCVNMFYHKTINLDIASINPAKTSDSASGETDGISCYPNFNQRRIYIDTVGLTDDRYKPEEILSAIRTFIRGIVHGLNVICICINYGRIDSDERKTLKTMEVIFGSTLFKNATVIVFNSPVTANITREQWEKTLEQKTKKLAECKHVLFVNNTAGTNNIEEFKNLRNNLLNDFENVMDNESNNLFKPCDGFLERIYDFFQLLFPKILVPNYQKIFQEMWKEIEKDCSLCKCSIKKEQEIILSCNHVFHAGCIRSWHQHQCQRPCPRCPNLLHSNEFKTE